MGRGLRPKQKIGHRLDSIIQNFLSPTSITLVVTLATRFKFWSPKTKFSRQNWALNHIDGVTSGVPAVSVVEYKSQSAQIKDYKISVFCISTKCIALRSNNKDWLE
jgi:hypothetical protein